MTELKRRWITAVVAVPILILIIQSSMALTTLAVIATLIALHEYYEIMLKELEFFHPIRLLGLAIGAYIIILSYTNRIHFIPALLFLNCLIASLFSLYFYEKDKQLPLSICKQTFGIIYVSILMSFLIRIRIGNNGAMWLYMTFAFIIACDTGAYFVGKQWGKNKLIPAISPGKTLEGLLGGYFACFMIVLICKLLFIPTLTWPVSLYMTFFIGSVGPLGDLFESMLKRSSGIKDSGSIFPGHGGILDRIDGLLFIGPVVFYIKEYFV